MTKIFSIIQHEEITEVCFSSPPEVNDLIAAAREHAGPRMHRKRLWDMSCGYNVSTVELNKIAQTGHNIEVPDNSRVAIVAPDDLSYGVTRIYSVLRKDSRSQHQVFRTREDALAWLDDPSGY